MRVLKPGDYTGINELYKDEDIPQKEGEELMMAEQIFDEITQLPFKVHTPTQWKHWLEDAGLIGVQIHKHGIKSSIKEGIELFSEFGVFKFMKTMTKMVRYTLSSKIIRYRIKKLEKAKIILTRKKSISRHVGYVLGRR